MKKLFILCSIIPLIFYSCEKGTTHDVVPNPKTELRNPYDFFGQHHNAAMQIMYDSISQGRRIDMTQFAQNYCANEFSLIDDVHDFQFWMARFDTIGEYIQAILTYMLETNNTPDFSVDIFYPLTLYQKGQLSDLFELIDLAESVEALDSLILEVETEVLETEVIESWEKGVVLGTISIAKFSLQFYETHFTQDRGPFLERVKKVVKADAAGFVGGAVGSFIAGHPQSATLVFGPQGAVVTVAADATVGAITGSGAEIVHQIVSH